LGKIDYKTVYLDGESGEWVVVFRNGTVVKCDEKMFDSLRKTIGV